LQPPEIPILDGQLSQEQAAASLAEVDDLERKIAAIDSAATEALGGDRATPVAEAIRKDAEEAKSRLRAMTQRPVRCHEHPRLLLDAITKTKERLLIISPWITHQVVNDMFVRSLDALLRNGVAVYIGYGLADEDGGRGNDKAKQKDPITYLAQKEFDSLKKRYDNLTLKFVGNTHRKMLVSDDRFAVVSSFNWLSFKGDPRSKARDEFGILVSEPAMLDDIFNDGLKLIEEGYDHPPTVSDGRDRRPHNNSGVKGLRSIKT
jgi:phosphatidylserine/phosphatidylglycerophosphate/cardiolipin synthase-like enzyme